MLDRHHFGATNKDAPYEPYPKSELASARKSFSSISKSVKLEALKSDWLGIGTARTWHGYPDARFRIGDNDTTLLIHDDLADRVASTIEAKLHISLLIK